jgi:hypothetical protein
VDHYPMLLEQTLLRTIYSLYLRGLSTEAIAFRVCFDERAHKGGQWEGLRPDIELINQCIDHCLEMDGIA